MVIKDVKIGARVDKVVTDYLASVGEIDGVNVSVLSRSRVTKNLGDFVKVGDDAVKPSYRFRDGDTVHIDVDSLKQVVAGVVKDAEDMSRIVSEKPPEGVLDILEETEDYIVLNKSHGLVVHPGVGNSSGTLANYLRWYLEDLGIYDPMLERAGIVHRLDKGVGGLMVVAKNIKAQRELKKLFEAHEVTKVYEAKVKQLRNTVFQSWCDSLWGSVNNGVGILTNDVDKLEQTKDVLRVWGYIRRDSVKRKRMRFDLDSNSADLITQAKDLVISGSHTVVSGKSLEIGASGSVEVKNGRRLAVSYITAGDENMLYIRIVTGRMHQIRATLRRLGYVINGDSLYGDKGVGNSDDIKLRSVFLSFIWNDKVQEYSIE